MRSDLHGLELGVASWAQLSSEADDDEGHYKLSRRINPSHPLVTGEPSLHNLRQISVGA